MDKTLTYRVIGRVKALVDNFTEDVLQHLVFRGNWCLHHRLWWSRAWSNLSTDKITCDDTKLTAMYVQLKKFHRNIAMKPFLHILQPGNCE